MNVNKQNNSTCSQQLILDLLVWDNQHILARIKEMNEQVKALKTEVEKLRNKKEVFSVAKLANELESRLGPWLFRALPAYYDCEEENEYYDYEEEKDYCTCTSNTCSIRHHIWE